jgi:predicted permease
MLLQRTLRRLLYSPLFAIVATATLALGIGANSAIFSVLDGVLLHPLPYAHAEALVDLNHAAPGVNFPDARISPFLFFTYRDQARSFESIALYAWSTRTVTGLAEAEQAQSLGVTAEFLPLLGVDPALGRFFSAADDAPGGEPTTILSAAWWQARFGADRSILGRHIVVDGVSRQVVGVLPPTFRFMDRDAAFLVPLQLDRAKAELGHFDFQAVARLRDGVTIGTASAEIARLIPVALHSYPVPPGLTLKAFEDVRLTPKLKFLKDALVGDIRPTLWILMGAIGLVLLIACANVANLLLVRADRRTQELAIRAALGATTTDLAADLLTESLVLSAVGGAGGLALSAAATRAIVAFDPAHVPRLAEVGVNPVVVLFTAGTALLTGLIFGLIPVMKYATPRMTEMLRASSRTTTDAKDRHRTQQLLVVVQVAAVLVLLVGAGLLLRTSVALRKVDPGFDAADALTVRLAVAPSVTPDPAATVALMQQVIDQVRGVAGVTAVGVTSVLPTDPGASELVYARDKTYGQGVPPLRRLKFVSPGLLAAIGNRLVAGRDFTWAETYERRTVALVSENLARELWGTPEAALGQAIRENLQGPWREVVGVVGDEHENGLQAAAPTVAYYPLLMSSFQGNAVSVRRTVSLVIRSPRADSATFLTEVQHAIRSANANIPVANVRTLAEIMNRSLARTTFALVLLLLSGLVALLIGVVGIYGVVAYAVSRRAREIAIRMALGARRTELARASALDGLRLAVLGISAGGALAVPLMRAATSVLFGVSPYDPWTLAVVSAGLVAAVMCASYIPAWRATQADPIQALRGGAK